MWNSHYPESFNVKHYKIKFLNISKANVFDESQALKTLQSNNIKKIKDFGHTYFYLSIRHNLLTFQSNIYSAVSKKKYCFYILYENL